jgi:hypothetical protein
MKSIDPFRPSPDEELGRLLREEMSGPDPDGFLDRLSHHLARFPAQPSQWDVLAQWARPRVMAAAVAAAFLLGVALYSNWVTHGGEPTTTAGIPAAAIMAPPGDAGPITYAILEGR